MTAATDYRALLAKYKDMTVNDAGCSDVLAALDRLWWEMTTEERAAWDAPADPADGAA